MAASLGKTIQAEILDSTEAENAFEPFWDKCKKYLIYGLVIGGLVLIPTGLMTGALNCSKCHSEIQSCQKYYDDNSVDNPGDKLNPHWKFQSAFCTYNSVHAGVYYLPLILFAMALVLLAIDKVFDVLFKSGPEIQSYYQLVQKELGEKNEMSSDVNRSLKMQVEMEQTFGHGSRTNVFRSYVIKNVLEILFSGGLLFGLVRIILAFNDGEWYHSSQDTICPIESVNGKQYFVCSGHNFHLDLFVVGCCIADLILLILFAFGALIWSSAGLGSLSQVMKEDHVKMKFSRVKHEVLDDHEITLDIEDLYYQNQDNKLLLDLLASSTGLGASLKILCLLDKRLMKMAEVSNLKLEHEDSGDDQVDIVVKFDDSNAVRNIFNEISGLNCLYIVQILPSIETASIQSLKYTHEEDEIKDEMKDKQEMETRFQNVDPNQDFEVRVSTMINGTIIAQISKTLEKKDKDLDKTIFLTPAQDKKEDKFQFVSVDLEL